MSADTSSNDETVQFARAALGRMAKLEIAPNPSNFTLWFHYFSDTYPDLRATIDTLLSEDNTLTEQQCAELYERFFTFDTESDNLSAAVARIERAMDRAASYLDEAGEGAAEFGEALAGVSGQLSDSQAPGSIKDVVDGIIQATRQMEAKTQDLESKLAASTTEISQLRHEVEATRREAATDALTGIANRKSFDIALRSNAAEALATIESGGRMCLLMADIDHFKKFNDTHGHQIGDQVLKLLAHTLTESIKGQDTAARYGGEEFAVILPRTSLQQAMVLADHIRERLSTKSIVNRRTGEQLGAITLSIGVAQYRPGEQVNELVARADEALYRAKHEGRNRVVSEEGRDGSGRVAVS